MARRQPTLADLWLLLLVGTLATSLVACRSDEGGQRAAQARSFADAQIRIERLRKQTPTDWAAIRAEYAKTAAIVRRIDAATKTEYAKEIPAALTRCAAGDQAPVQQQIVAKGLQHVAVLAIRRALDEMASQPAKAKALAGEVAAFVSGIEPTLVRRDKDYFGSSPQLAPAAKAAVEAVRAAASSPAALPGARRQIEDVIARAYALSVLYEVQSVEALRSSDIPGCDKKRMEAQVFYRIIADRVRRKDPAADRALVQALAGPYASMSATVVEEQLRRGLPDVPLR